MNSAFDAAMRQALALTRASNPAGATAAIQRALRGGDTAAGVKSDAQDIAPHRPQGSSPTLVIDHDPLESVRHRPKGSAVPPTDEVSSRSQQHDRPRLPLGEVVRILRAGGRHQPQLGRLPGMGCRTVPILPEGAQFLTRSFSCRAGSRNYRIYIPAPCSASASGLVVMLHGCNQNADDFATGTNMNAAAGAQGLVVIYPEQDGSANSSSCWNWFNPGDQKRDVGEPSIIAGITRDVMAEFDFGRERTFVAGLSAGGAMAAVMGETYPDLYAAIGVHSGLAYGSANDVVSAFAAMRGNRALSKRSSTRGAVSREARTRTIIFHGTSDPTVHPSNAEGLVSSARHARTAKVEDQRCSANGRTFTKQVIRDTKGVAIVESWLIEGAGHAWFGGNPAGSYTDPRGPDASAEMIRFFLQES